MAQAISSAKGLVITPQASSAAAAGAIGNDAQASDNSVFSQLLGQLQTMLSTAGTSPQSQPQLDSLLNGKGGAAADKLLLSSQLSADGNGTVDAASLAQMLQAMLAGAQSTATAANDAGRQQLPVAAGIAAKTLVAQMQLPDANSGVAAQEDSGFSQALAATSNVSPQPKTAASAPPGLEQVMAKLAEALRGASAADAQAPVAAPVSQTTANKDVLPSDVRLMFRAEGNRGQEDSPASVDGKLLADQAGVLAAGATKPQTQPEQPMQEIRQPMTRDSSAWRQAFADKLSNMVQLKLDSASIKVTPEHLGPLDISISFDSQNKAQISVIAANHAAREIVASGLPQLGKMLEQSGIQMGNVEVSSQQQFASQQDQHWQQGQHHGRQRRQDRGEFSPLGDDALTASQALDAVSGTASTTDQLSIRA